MKRLSPIRKHERDTLHSASYWLNHEADSIKKCNINSEGQWDGDYREAKIDHDAMKTVARRLARIIKTRTPQKASA